jgi:hypothetical protein
MTARQIESFVTATLGPPPGGQWSAIDKSRLGLGRKTPDPCNVASERETAARVLVLLLGKLAPTSLLTPLIGLIALLFGLVTIIKRVRIDPSRRMRQCGERSSGPAPLPLPRSWADYIINTSGYDF